MSLKKYILFLLVGMCISCSKKRDLALFDIQGDVKTYTENYFKAEHKFGEWQKGEPYDGFGNMRVTFDANGYYKSLEFLDKDNNLTEKMIPEREGGKIVSELKYNPEGELKEKMEITHSSDTKIKFQNSDVEEGITSKGISFLENGRIVRQEITLLSSHISSSKRQKIILEYTYDQEGRIISQKQTNQDDGIVSDYNFKYIDFDEKGNWTKRLEYDEKDKETPKKVATRVYEYYE